MKLYFKDGMSIPSGEAVVPALLWKANKERLCLFALLDEVKPSIDTQLYYAPFLNVYMDGRVCMGTVKVEIPENCPLEEFISTWQGYFFNSYFSHAVAGGGKIKGNIVSLWKKQVETGRPFPTEVLVPAKKNVESLLA